MLRRGGQHSRKQHGVSPPLEDTLVVSGPAQPLVNLLDQKHVAAQQDGPPRRRFDRK